MMISSKDKILCINQLLLFNTTIKSDLDYSNLVLIQAVTFLFILNVPQ